MQIGMNLLLWTASLSRDHFRVLDDLAAWGYDGIELSLFAPFDAIPVPEIAARLDDLGMRRTAGTVMPESANPIHPDAAVRRAAGDHLRRIIDLCAEYRFEALAGPFCSPVGRLVGRGRTAEEWGWCVEVLRTAAEHARAAGVVLAIEPLNRFETYFVNCLADASTLVDEIGVPGCGILFDTFHANIEEKDVAQAIRRAGSRITYVHTSENDRSTPGQGHVPWQAVFAALREIGYDGWLTIEAFGQAMPEIAAATCIWRRMYGTEEGLVRDGLAFLREQVAAVA